jgi:predicted acetyltransferase
MNEYELISPRLEDKEELLKMIEEIKIVDEGKRWQYAGTSSLEKLKYEEWLEKVTKESIGKELAPNRVPASTFILVRNSDNKVVGIINIRHELNDYLLNFGGHIGYSIRPSERRKGLGTLQLEKALKIAKELNISRVLLTCDSENIGSAKTIEKCQGKLENFITKADGSILKRYWINN